MESMNEDEKPFDNFGNVWLGTTEMMELLKSKKAQKQVIVSEMPFLKTTKKPSWNETTGLLQVGCIALKVFRVSPSLVYYATSTRAEILPLTTLISTTMCEAQSEAVERLTDAMCRLLDIVTGVDLGAAVLSKTNSKDNKNDAV